ncbi:hypothetical protein NX722_23585 [Endozoicomonas gorgoniicola]|uniref:Transposase IS30-like HTH domain-containing protein n=1 Tax=Endozoicomonas gorgoniicola TaxID=1234144 RepID=A0ABT3N1P4_9GAMM|nr:hypothetical protein [Endozoicomonas gorgoniicola]MCW7555550.1 hypothetical protein [Endozoicomonas gorgoniicola]
MEEKKKKPCQFAEEIQQRVSRGDSHREIAKALDLNPDSTRIYIARKKLRPVKQQKNNRKLSSIELLLRSSWT